MNLFSILGFVGDAIGAQVGSVVQWALAGFGTLFSDISGVWGILTSFIDWAKKALASVVGFLTRLWDWLRNHILRGIIDWINRHFQALRAWLRPLIRWIQLERQMLYQLWNTYVKPLMDFIQKLRRFLVVFRLLGFKWAKELDAYLVKLENKINRAFLGAFQNLNILADWINWITDPFGLWSSNVWLGAIGQSIGAIIGLVWGKMNTPGFGALPPLASYDADDHYTDYRRTLARMHERTALGLLQEDNDDVQAAALDWASAGWP